MFKRNDILGLAKIEQGVPLWGCAPGSPAALAGLRYGDIVLSVNGRRTRTVEEYVASKNTGAKYHEVKVRRGADMLTLTIAPGPDLWPDVTEYMVEVVGEESFWNVEAGDPPRWRN